MSDELLTYEQAAVELGVSSRTIQRWLVTREYGMRREHVTEPQLGWRIPRSVVERVKRLRADEVK